MPKPFGSSSAARNPMAVSVLPSGAVETSPRPEMRPENLTHNGSTLPGRIESFLPERGSQEQHDMIMQLVQAGMSNAQASGSPLANFLAPLAGSLIAGRATRKLNDAKSERSSKMISAVLGDVAENPQVIGHIDVLNDPDAPAYLKGIAKSRLDAIINPRTTPSMAGGGKRGVSAAQSINGQINRRLYGEYDIGGVLHGRDNYGKMVPYTGPDGKPVLSSRGGETSTQGTTPTSVVDELAALTQQPAAPAASNIAATTTMPPALDENDPLGILNIPPA